MGKLWPEGISELGRQKVRTLKLPTPTPLYSPTDEHQDSPPQSLSIEPPAFDSWLDSSRPLPMTARMNGAAQNESSSSPQTPDTLRVPIETIEPVEAMKPIAATEPTKPAVSPARHSLRANIAGDVARFSRWKKWRFISAITGSVVITAILLVTVLHFIPAAQSQTTAPAPIILPAPRDAARPQDAPRPQTAEPAPAQHLDQLAPTTPPDAVPPAIVPSAKAQPPNAPIPTVLPPAANPPSRQQAPLTTEKRLPLAAKAKPAKTDTRAKHATTESRGQATLEVFSTSWANISVDGERRGVTPLILILPPGPHQLRAEREGLPPVEYTITLEPGETRRWSPQLRSSSP